MAKRVASRLEGKLRDMLKLALPKLQERAQKYASSGSADPVTDMMEENKLEKDMMDWSDWSHHWLQ